MATTKKISSKSKPKVVKKTEKNKVGRPTKFTKEIGDAICDRMADGESLLRICRDEKMPNRATVHRWLLATHEKEVEGVNVTVYTYQEFCDKYEMAVALRADHMFDEIEDIADGAEGIVKKGAEKKSGAYAQTQRLRVDTRKWYLSKIMPKKFSDKNVHVTEDKDGNTMPITGNVIQFASQNEKGNKPQE